MTYMCTRKHEKNYIYRWHQSKSLLNIWHQIQTHIFGVWCCAISFRHHHPLLSSPPPRNQRINNQQRIIEILYILKLYHHHHLRIIDLSWPEDCCCFPMYRPSRLRWAADKWGTNPCCCGSRTGTCGHNHRTSQHARLSDVARKMWSGKKKKLPGWSRQEEVVVRKLFKKVCQNKDRFNRRGKLHGQKNNKTIEPHNTPEGTYIQWTRLRLLGPGTRRTSVKNWGTPAVSGSTNAVWTNAPPENVSTTTGTVLFGGRPTIWFLVRT